MTSATLDRTAAPESADEPPKKGKKKLLVIGLVLVVGAAAGWWFLLRPSGPTEPEPGEVMTLEPIQVNLADGHYLRLGLALQLSADAHEADGSKALDAAIDLFSGADQSALVKAGQRQDLKHELEEKLHEDYHGDVLEVYFTEFVTQ
ncbi:flagellar basal body-associated FliL family protein [Nocardioides oleivorans]|uniref:Flagellar protein FliL n=1 Tax=Nocardioides oleivorans TaxID=273676 RepID=A0A4Q2S2C6_9ACTN|nr:flagellar basal body-associated FliL family protein [Nocardioides oleivorans]RYB94243.1 flagellar basal body-associated FliL family protein [Nocardioides oleivorans]